MSLGLCIVCENVVGLPTYAEDGYNCKIVESGNIDGYVNEVIDLISHYEIRSEYAHNAKVTSRQFDSDLQCGVLEELIYSEM